MSKKQPAYELVPLHSRDSHSDDDLTVYDRKFGEGTYKIDADLQLYNYSHKTYYPLLSFKTKMLLCAVVLLIALITAILCGYVLFVVWNNTLSINDELSSTSIDTVPTETPSSIPHHHFNNVQTTLNNPYNWIAEFDNRMSEMSILLHDIDGDNVPDIIIDQSTLYQSPDYDYCPGKKDRCKEMVGFSPCQSQLIALNGKSGAIEWSQWVEYAPFAVNCRTDLNWNGQNDCIFSGRGGSLSAYDVHNNVLLWVVDQRITCPSYNYYYPLISKDFDKDGVSDIIVTHGGDPRYPDTYKERTPGFIVVVSGATGKQISEHILTPDNHETYSSPVLYTIPEGTDVVLFGTGGETIAGSLWAISLNSLESHVTKYIKEHNLPYKRNKMYKPLSCYSSEEIQKSRPHFNNNGKYSTKTHESWMDDCPHLLTDYKPIWNIYKLCVYEFIPAGTLGTMLPPVIVDINRDGKNDLLVSQFGEHTLLYDGKAGSIIWDYNAPDTQTYSLPAPLHFNEDNVLDIAVRFNKGRWMTYDYSYMGVLDGTNGKLLWSVNCSTAVMSSPVTLLNKKKGHDGVMFLGIGCNMASKEDVELDNSNTNDENQSNKREKRHLVKNTCPRKYFEAEMERICQHGEQLINKRDEFHEMSEEFFSMDGSGHQKTDLFNFKYIPKDLWVSSDPTDVFPDPWTETEDFIQDYCGYDLNSLVTGLYFVTANTVKDLIPLYVFRPYVHKPSSVREQRHDSTPSEGDNTNHEENGGDEFLKKLKKLIKNRKGLRCAHILAPIQSEGTPTITDLDGDGKPEVVVSIVYSEIPGYYSVPVFEFLHPPKLVIQTFTIEDQFKLVHHGNHDNESTNNNGGELIDFSSYYSIAEQPWTEYMGTNGDGIFVHPSDK